MLPHIRQRPVTMERFPSGIKTSGSKGFHIVVPIEPDLAFDEVAAFASSVAAILVQRHSSTLTLEFSKAERGGRIYVDVGRNGYSATFAAAYSVRPKPGAPVSAPCRWDEIENGLVGPRTFTLHSMARRLEEVGDLWSDMVATRCSLRGPIDRLQQGGQFTR
jgi:bifunctional non-homologous end joining protein LigD